MEEAMRKAHKKGTGGGEGLPVMEKKEEALHQRVVDLCADDLSFCGITGGYQTKICLGPAPTKSELLNVNIVSSGSSDEVDDVKSKVLIERNEMPSTPFIISGCSSANTCMNIEGIKDSEQVNKKQCSSSQSSNKRKSISEELQDAQLKYFKEQTEKVKLQQQLILEEIATSKAKRRFFERVTKDLEQKEASRFLQILSDE